MLGLQFFQFFHELCFTVTLYFILGGVLFGNFPQPFQSCLCRLHSSGRLSYLDAQTLNGVFRFVCHPSVRFHAKMIATCSTDISATPFLGLSHVSHGMRQMPTWFRASLASRMCTRSLFGRAPRLFSGMAH